MRNHAIINKVRNELREVDSHISEWHDRIGLTPDEASDVFDCALLELLENKAEILKTKLETLVAADQEAWEELENGLAEGLDDVKKSLDETKKNMEKRITMR